MAELEFADEKHPKTILSSIDKVDLMHTSSLELKFADDFEELLASISVLSAACGQDVSDLKSPDDANDVDEKRDIAVSLCANLTNLKAEMQDLIKCMTKQLSMVKLCYKIKNKEILTVIK